MGLRIKATSESVHTTPSTRLHATQLRLIGFRPNIHLCAETERVSAPVDNRRTQTNPRGRVAFAACLQEAHNCLEPGTRRDQT